MKSSLSYHYILKDVFFTASFYLSFMCHFSVYTLFIGILTCLEVLLVSWDAKSHQRPSNLCSEGFTDLGRERSRARIGQVKDEKEELQAWVELSREESSSIFRLYPVKIVFSGLAVYQGSASFHTAAPFLLMRSDGE